MIKIKKDVLTTRLSVSIVILILFGSSFILGVSTLSGQDSWIAILVAGVLACPLMIIYARIMKLFPGKDIFEIMELTLGKIAGKVLITILILYTQLFTALVLRNFTEFIEVTNFTETPQTPLAFAMIIVVIYMCKSSISTFGKWAGIAVVVCCALVSASFFLSIKDFNYDNMAPLFEHTPGNIFYSALNVLSFPLAETVLFLGIASSVKPKANPYKIFLYGLGIGLIFLLMVNIRNFLVLGVHLTKTSYFPSYVAGAIISIGEYIARIEGSISLTFVIAGLTKLAIGCYVTSIGFSRLFGMKDYKDTLVPITLTSVALSIIIYKSTMEMMSFANDYSIFALPFQVLIPIMVWIASEAKSRKNKKEYAKQAS